MFNATGIGSLPGVHPAEAARIIAGELTAFAHVAELPARGPGADMIGRTAALLASVAPEFAVDTTPSGWRFVDAPGRIVLRAQQWLVEDLDCTEEALFGFAGQIKQQLVGPWTLAASIEMRTGERAVRDHGAVRDLAGALAEAAALQVNQLRRRIPGAVPMIQFDEPSLPTVLAGGVTTASGLATYRSVDPQRARELLALSIDSVRAAGGLSVIHCCAPNPPIDIMRIADGVSFDLSLAFDEDQVGEIVDQGTSVMIGAVSTAPQEVPSTDFLGEAVARRVQRQLSRWGFDVSQVGERISLTPTCGLARSTPSWARTAYAALEEAGRLLRDEGRDGESDSA